MIRFGWKRFDMEWPYYNLGIRGVRDIIIGELGHGDFKMRGSKPALLV